MELTINILASGSSGNAIFVQAGGTGILLDAGLSYRELAQRASLVGADLSRLAGILVSHEHADHIQGVPLVSRKCRAPLFVNKATYEEIHRRRRDFNTPVVEHFETGDTIAFNGIAVRTFPVCHDAADPVGFVLSWEGLKVGVVTDVGQVTRLLAERLRECHLLILESNHDVRMLDAGPYPPELKRRIKGRNGHLSNDQCAELLGSLCHPDLRHVVLAHLSEKNNTPVLAYATACRSLPALADPPRITVASQSKPVMLRLSAHRVEAMV